MLHHLYIRNYALFAEVNLDFPSGLVVLTGETGAGKSLLVGALGLIMGKRADSSVIFRENEKSLVEARFHHLSPSIQALFRQSEDFDFETDELVIRREITPAGKSRAFINDTPVTLDVLRDTSSLLVDLHGQHQNQTLLSTDYQRNLLDLFADHAPLLQEFSTLLADAEALKASIRQMEQQEQESKQQLDYLRFQQEDLEKANVQTDEEQQLEDELQLLHHAEEIIEAVGKGANLLYHQEESLYETLHDMLEPLKKVRNVSKTLEEEVGKLEQVSEQMKESALALQNILDGIESDPERLAFIEQRLATYHQLKLKYGKKNGQELVELLREVQEKIDAFGSLEDRITSAHLEWEKKKSRLADLGQKIEHNRLKARPALEEKILSVLHRVGFDKARFEVAVERLSAQDGWLQLDDQPLTPHASGINKVYFMIQTNPGMPSGPLAQIASGGEISRVMLAIKAALADRSEFPVMIFDEIDTGISGEIANKVGGVMKQLAEKFQILSITHLPQIAAKGHSQFLIKKDTSGDMTTSEVTPLDEFQRIVEIAKMLSGEEPSPSALRNAKELIAAGSTYSS